MDWRKCFDRPCEWALNQYFEILDKNCQFAGEVYFALQYIPEGLKDPGEEPEDIERGSSGLEEGKKAVRGRLFFNVQLMKDLRLIDEKKSKIEEKRLEPFFKLELPDNSKYKSKRFKLSSERGEVYLCQEKLNFNIDLEDEEDLENLRLLLFHHGGIFGRDKPIGKVEFPIFECVSSPGEWVINSTLSIVNDFEVMKKAGVSEVG